MTITHSLDRVFHLRRLSTSFSSIAAPRPAKRFLSHQRKRLKSALSACTDGLIIPMPTTARSQQRYDHRLRNLVQRTGM